MRYTSKLVTFAAIMIAQSMTALAQAPSVSFTGPSTNPTAPRVSPAQLNTQINAGFGTLYNDVQTVEGALNSLTPANINAVPYSQYVTDQNALKAAISVLQTPPCVSSGLCTFKDANGNSYTVSANLVSNTPTLVSDGTSVISLQGNSFAWANQPSSATVTGGGGVGTTAEMDITAIPHPAPNNQAMLKAKLPTFAHCIKVGMYITDPSATGNYSSGIALLNTATGNNAVQFMTGASANGAFTGVYTETDFFSSNGVGKSASPFPTYTGALPQYSVSWMEECNDNTTITFAWSSSGTLNSWHVLASGTVASFGSPNDFGLFTDAKEDSNGESYNSVAHFTNLEVDTGANIQSAVASPDPTQTFLITRNFPTTDTLPSISGFMGTGFTFPSGATNDFGVIFGTNTSGANITNTQAVFNNFWTSFSEGNPLGNPIGSPYDTGQGDNSTFASVARTYAVGDPNSVHTMLSDGLMLSNNCSHNHTQCTPGQIYGGMIDASVNFVPGQTIGWRAKLGAGAHRWTPVWFFRDLQFLNGNSNFATATSNGLQSNGSFVLYCDNNANGQCYELDGHDAFVRGDGPTPAGKEVIFWTPQYGQFDGNVPITNPAYRAYMANTSSYSDIEKNEAYNQINNYNCSTQFCDYTVDWEAATIPGAASNAHYIDMFVAPVPLPAGQKPALISRIAMEFTPTTLGPNGGPFGLSMILSAAQAIPGSALNGGVVPNYNAITENDGIANGWSIEIQNIWRVKADVVNPTSYEPTN